MLWVIEDVSVSLETSSVVLVGPLIVGGPSFEVLVCYLVFIDRSVGRPGVVSRQRIATETNTLWASGLANVFPHKI